MSVCVLQWEGHGGRKKRGDLDSDQMKPLHFKRETIHLHLPDRRGGFSEHKGEDVYHHPPHSWT